MSVRATGTILLLLFCLKVRAQDTSVSYADSVRDFFAEYLKAGYTVRLIVLDNPRILTDWGDSCLLQAPDRILRKNSAKVYQLNNYAEYEERTDSILLTRKEIMFFARRMINPLVTKWDSSFFPRSKFVTQSEVKVFNYEFRALSRLVSDSLTKCQCDYGDEKIINYPLYIAQKKMRKGRLYINSYSRISNPVFLRKGQLAVVYEYNSIAATPSWYHLVVYKRTPQGWKYFGKLEGGEF